MKGINGFKFSALIVRLEENYVNISYDNIVYN